MHRVNSYGFILNKFYANSIYNVLTILQISKQPLPSHHFPNE